MPEGTIVNTLAVLAGSTLGLLLQKRFPENVRTISFQAIGLYTLLIGMQMALKVENLLILIFILLCLSLFFKPVLHFLQVYCSLIFRSW